MRTRRTILFVGLGVTIFFMYAGLAVMVKADTRSGTNLGLLIMLIGSGVGWITILWWRGGR